MTIQLQKDEQGRGGVRKKRGAVHLELKYSFEGDDKYEMYYRWQKH